MIRFLLAGCLTVSVWAQPWLRHTIDNTSLGADGVRLADVDGDGLLDIATAWEEGGEVRIYRNPGPPKAKDPWPRVTVGRVRSPEDAVFTDLDGDGTYEVVSSCEGSQRTVFLHWPPGLGQDYWKADGWTTRPVEVSRGRMRWMFAAPGEIGVAVALFAGGKQQGGEIGWFEIPGDPPRTDEWRWHPLRPAGWVMSLIPKDMDGDGDVDLLFSDRKGVRTGVYWLENPGSEASAAWKQHLVGAAGREVMFLDAVDLDGDGLEDVLAAVRPREIQWFRRLDGSGMRWEPEVISIPPVAGTAKAVKAADLDGDGRLEIVFSCERAAGNLEGVMYLSPGRPGPRAWEPHSLSGPEGVKFDLIQILDLDGDGDLDVLTCEERTNLGVIWYENPRR